MMRAIHAILSWLLPYDRKVTLGEKVVALSISQASRGTGR